jgi:hypothetical protein
MIGNQKQKVDFDKNVNLMVLPDHGGFKNGKLDLIAKKQRNLAHKGFTKP